MKSYISIVCMQSDNVLNMEIVDLRHDYWKCLEKGMLPKEKLLGGFVHLANLELIKREGLCIGSDAA